MCVCKAAIWLLLFVISSFLGSSQIDWAVGRTDEQSDIVHSRLPMPTFGLGDGDDDANDSCMTVGTALWKASNGL